MIEKKVLQPLHSFDPSTSKLSETQRPLNVETGGGGVMKAHTPTPPSMPSTGSSSNIARLSSIKMSSENGVKLSLSHRQLPKLEPVLKGTSAGSYSQPSSPVDSHHHAPIFNIPTSAPGENWDREEEERGVDCKGETRTHLLIRLFLHRHHSSSHIITRNNNNAGECKYRERVSGSQQEILFWEFPNAVE